MILKRKEKEYVKLNAGIASMTIGSGTLINSVLGLFGCLVSWACRSKFRAIIQKLSRLNAMNHSTLKILISDNQKTFSQRYNSFLRMKYHNKS